ncbi:hypothetical protein J4Q44_G00052480, partial [Coregonus suidteri]
MLMFASFQILSDAVIFFLAKTMSLSGDLNAPHPRRLKAKRQARSQRSRVNKTRQRR